MNLIDYAAIIVKRGWIIILFAVSSLVAAYGFSLITTPVYRGSQTVLLVPSRTDLGLTEAALRLVELRQSYLTSELIAGNIIDDLQLDITPAQLLQNTTFTRDNLAIQIDVDLPSIAYQDAARMITPIVAGWSQELIDHQNDLNQSARQEDRIQARVQDNPRVFLLNPNMRVNTIIGGVAGSFLGIVLVLVLEYLESNVIKSQRHLDAIELKTLGVIPTD